MIKIQWDAHRLGRLSDNTIVPASEASRMPTVDLRPADADDLDVVEDLLAANDLPTADVREKPDCFYLAFEGGKRVGAGGLEVHGTDGLLRSVVVQADERGQGFGGALCDALEDEARDRDLAALYLLTTTAADFFARRGYERVDRDAVPEPIRATSEFADLCPESAVPMRTSL